jgi:BirA family biotin operon repressor/biotin-[acetyl-CoA-carboxylase] ligase
MMGHLSHCHRSARSGLSSVTGVLDPDPIDPDPIDPDPIDPRALRDQLVGPGRWRRVDVVAETGSTNADLAERARRGEEPGVALIADFQSAGRGRRGRVWTAPPGSSLAMSALLRPRGVPLASWTWVPLLAGLAVVEGLGACAGVAARLKWPNDVLVGGRKICGILVERVETPSGPACVVGLGINVRLSEAELPVPTATSFALLDLPVVPPRTTVAVAVLRALETVIAGWERDPGRTPAAYRAVSDTVGRDVQVVLADDRTVHGRASDIDADGRLVLQTSDGLLVVGAGDVVHLR